MSSDISTEDSVDDPLEATNFQGLLSDVIESAQLPAKRRGTSIKPTIEKLNTACYENGVLPDALRGLLDLITSPNHLDQASLGSIVRNLYPSILVDGDSTVKVVGCLGHGTLKPSLAIQVALVRWLIMVHHVVSNADALTKSYPVLFNLLDTAALRPQICHLLALITRRRHVRPYRIQTLLSLSRQTGNDPALTGLLRVFKDYYPEIIVGEATRGKASAFKHPDPQWRQRLDEIQQAQARSIETGEQKRGAFRVFRRIGRSVEQVGDLVIPEVHTSHANENSVTLEEIDNVDSLVMGLEKIELPNQLVAVLADSLLQKLLLLKGDGESHQRISNWVTSFARDMLSGEDTSNLKTIIEVMLDYVSTTKTMPPVILDFYTEYLKQWNGKDHQENILKTLTHCGLPDSRFSDLYEQVFQAIEKPLLDGTIEMQLVLLRFYTALLQHWAVLLSSLRNIVGGDPVATSELMAHVNGLTLSILQTSNAAADQNTVLDFYETASWIASNSRLEISNIIVIPPPSLVFTLNFSLLPSSISRLYGILAAYKDGFQQVRSNHRYSGDYSEEYINRFNGFLMDICNCLWRSRAFNTADVNAMGCLLTKDVSNQLGGYVKRLAMSDITLGSLFNLSVSPTISSLSAQCVVYLEQRKAANIAGKLITRHMGPVTRSGLKRLAKDGGLNVTYDYYREAMLEYLGDRALPGVDQLMRNTMTTLIKKT